MTLKITATQLAVLHEHARQGYPHEVVGILAGDRSSDTVLKVVPLVNERAESAHNRYKVSGLVVHRAETALADEGLQVVGYYHSHPDHPSRYSDYDRDHALPNMAYLINQVLEGKTGTTQVWRLREDRSAMDEQLLQTLEA